MQVSALLAASNFWYTTLHEVAQNDDQWYGNFNRNQQVPSHRYGSPGDLNHTFFSFLFFNSKQRKTTHHEASKHTLTHRPFTRLGPQLQLHRRLHNAMLRHAGVQQSRANKETQSQKYFGWRSLYLVRLWVASALDETVRMKETRRWLTVLTGKEPLPKGLCSSGWRPDCCIPVSSSECQKRDFADETMQLGNKDGPQICGSSM